MTGNSAGMQRSQIANSKHRVGRRTVVLLLAALASSVFATSTLAAAQPLPAASTGGVSSVTPSSVVLHGSLDAKTYATNYVFQYGPTKFYGGQTPLAPGGRAASTIQVSQLIGGLQANTIYHYRIIATSARGSTPGVDRTFKTPKVPLSLQIAGAPNPVPFGDPFTVQGTLSGTGNAGRVVALQTNPFPYAVGFKTLGNFEVTSSTGSFSFPVVGLLTNTQLRIVTTSAPYVTSPVMVEGVAVQVTLHVRRVHRPRRGEFVRFYGTITPAELGAHVGFQLTRRGAPSVNQGGTIVTSGTPTLSRFSTVVRIRRHGVYQALVQVFDGSHVSAYSEPIRIG
jgi:hypothetical protein